MNESDLKVLDALKKSVSQPESDETFTISIKARRCKRCGGLLTGEQAIKDGYGHICKMKARAEGIDPDQITISI